MAKKDPAFSERLLLLLKQRDISPAGLAKKVGRPYPTVHAYLREGRIPEAPILLQISRVLGVSMEKLLGEERGEGGPKTYTYGAGIDLRVSSVAEESALARDMKRAAAYLKAMDDETRGVALRILADMTRLRGE